MADHPPEVVFAGSLLKINVGAAGALLVLNPLLAQIDLTLFGSLGIGALTLDLQAQLNANISLMSGISLGISDPLEGFLALQAALKVALSLPSISVEANLQLSAMASFSAVLAAQIGGLEVAIQAALAVKIPAMRFAASLAAGLNVGPLFVLSFENQTLASVGSSLAAQFNNGLVYPAIPPYSESIGFNEPVYGMVIVTKDISAWAGLSATMLVA